MSPKWCAGAVCDTPARRATSRRLNAPSPRSSMTSTAAAAQRVGEIAVVVAAVPEVTATQSTGDLDDVKFDLYSVNLSSATLQRTSTGSHAS